jgi:hypothetical protein
MRDAGSTLWTVRSQSGRFVECVARLAPNGVEVEIISDAWSLITHRFVTGAEAIVWAEETRDA